MGKITSIWISLLVDFQTNISIFLYLCTDLTALTEFILPMLFCMCPLLLEIRSSFSYKSMYKKIHRQLLKLESVFDFAFILHCCITFPPSDLTLYGHFQHKYSIWFSKPYKGKIDLRNGNKAKVIMNVSVEAVNQWDTAGHPA